MTSVLVVDDEPAILRAVRAGLSAHRYEVTAVSTGWEALAYIADKNPDLVVLDLGLPDLDGVEIVRRVREWSDVPILVLSADGSDHRKVAALDTGADDYVTKPFSMPELLARVRVAVRHGRAGQHEAGPVLEVGDLRMDLLNHEATLADERVDLTRKEFDMLALLARWPGRVVTHRTILQDVWGPAYTTETQYLRVYASQLRKKLGAGPQRPRLKADPGIGYRLLLDE